MRYPLILLPYPPSANSLTRHRGRGVYRNPKYTRWLGAACKLRMWRNGLIEDPVAVEIRACPPDRRRRDLDNIVKPVLDALTRAGVWSDDHLVHRLSVLWDRENVENGVLISITALNAGEPG